ncbi:alpha/beta hydrolase [Micromonospora sp. BRA006-A]|nr:alpha/beta hydrolase [Micromonospora sp. BRA006-A]
MPVLIIQGDKDNVLPFPVTGQRLVNMLSDAKLVTLKGAPHGTPWTHPTEVNKAIMEFIGKPSMATA